MINNAERRAYIILCKNLVVSFYGYKFTEHSVLSKNISDHFTIVIIIYNVFLFP